MAEGVRDDVNVCRLCGVLEDLSLCGRCRTAWYCCKEHQTEDWKEHKRTCGRSNGNFEEKQKPRSSKSRSRSERSVSSNTSKSTTITTKLTGSSKDNISNGNRPAELVSQAATSLSDQQKDFCNKFSKIMPNEEEPQTSDGDIQNFEPRSTSPTLDDTWNRTPPSMSPVLKQEGLLPLTPKNGGCESGQSCVTITQSSVICGPSDVGCERVQVLDSPETVLQPTRPRSKSKAARKKKEKISVEADNSLALTEQTPLQERYYLNQATHKINLPSTARGSNLTSLAAASAMGQRDCANLSAVETREQYLLILQSRFKEVAKYVVQCLTRYGICVLDKFLGDATTQEIFSEVLELDRTGIMQQGQLVQGPTSSRNKHIRGDVITWLDGTEPQCENIHFLISCMDAVMLQCSSKLSTCKINERTKAMVACYPGKGTGYLRHVDNPNGDGRCITCIYYLNKDWDVRLHGGLLRIYPEGTEQVANIEPKFDRLLFFWSDRRNPHEVEQAMKERYAITVWYYDADERAGALKKFKGSHSSNPKSQAVPLLS